VAVEIPRSLEEDFVRLTLASAVKDPNNPFVGEEKFNQWIQQAAGIKTAFKGDFAI